MHMQACAVMISSLVMYLSLFQGPSFQNRMVPIQVLWLVLWIWVKYCRSPLNQLAFSQLSSEKNPLLCAFLTCYSVQVNSAKRVSVCCDSPWGILPLGVTFWAVWKALCEWLCLEILSGEILGLPLSLLSPELHVRTMVVFTHLSNTCLFPWDWPNWVIHSHSTEQLCSYAMQSSMCSIFSPKTFSCHILFCKKYLMSLLYQPEPWLPPWLSLLLNIVLKACHFFCCMFCSAFPLFPHWQN